MLVINNSLFPYSLKVLYNIIYIAARFYGPVHYNIINKSKNQLESVVECIFLTD